MVEDRDRKKQSGYEQFRRTAAAQAQVRFGSVEYIEVARAAAASRAKPRGIHHRPAATSQPGVAVNSRNRYHAGQGLPRTTQADARIRLRCCGKARRPGPGSPNPMRPCHCALRARGLMARDRGMIPPRFSKGSRSARPLLAASLTEGIMAKQVRLPPGPEERSQRRRQGRGGVRCCLRQLLRSRGGGGRAAGSRAR